MRHRKFVVATTVMMFMSAAVIAGLAFYSAHVAKASVPNLPHSIHYLPTTSQGVFGMNVQKFIQSPFYAKLQSKQGDRIGQDLQEFIAKTGVDPTKDVQYIVAAARPGTGKGAGVAIAVGTFNSGSIIAYINSKGTPIETAYKKGKVLMIPESNGSTLEHGIAFLSNTEIAMGDLESLKQVLDIQAGDASGIDSTSLGTLIASLDPGEMFWFAGDATSVMAKTSATTPFAGNLSTIRTIYGTLDLTTAIMGKVTATTVDADSANKLVAVVNGFVALGTLAAQSSNQTQDIKDLIAQIKIQATATDKDVNLTLNVPFDVLDKLEQIRPQMAPRKVAK